MFDVNVAKMETIRKIESNTKEATEDIYQKITNATKWGRFQVAFPISKTSKINIFSISISQRQLVCYLDKIIATFREQGFHCQLGQENHPDYSITYYLKIDWE